jgi:parallel beta-helix repeat protein
MRLPLLLLIAVSFSSGSVFGQHFDIRDDAQGGDCRAQQIGTWDQASKTCTLTSSQIASISIEDDGITLDGQGLMLRHGPRTGAIGVFLRGRKGVVVRRLRIFGFREGIVITQGHSNTVENCFVSGPTATMTGIALDRTDLNHIRSNRIISCQGNGISLQNAHRNRVTKNAVLLNPQGSILMWDSHGNLLADNQLRGTGAIGSLGIRLSSSHRNEITWNSIGRHSQFGLTFNKSDANRVSFNRIINNDLAGFNLWDGNHNRLYCNDFQGQILGVELLGQALGNQIWWNNFYLNDSATDLVGGGLNHFQHPRPEGGNYWRPHTPNCADANGDRFCDAPYVFRGNQDGLPHVQQIPWRANPSICISPPEITPYEQQKPQVQPGDILAGLVGRIEMAISESRLEDLLPFFSADIALITSEGTTEGGDAVLAGLEENLDCGGDAPAVPTVTGLPTDQPTVMEFRIIGCGHNATDLLVVFHVTPTTGDAKIELLVLSEAPES